MAGFMSQNGILSVVRKQGVVVHSARTKPSASINKFRLCYKEEGVRLALAAPSNNR